MSDYKAEMENYKRQLTMESAQKAAEMQIPDDGTGHNNAEDAFRHAYSSALVTYDYNRGVAYAAGVYNEWNTPNNPPGEERMDTYNNKIGIQIGSESGSREEIAVRVYNTLTRGELIIDPKNTDPSSPFPENDDNYTPPLGTISENFVEGEWDWMKLPGSGSNGSPNQFDPSALIRALGGRKRNTGSTGQIMLTSAASLARELLKAKRKSLEDDLVDIFTGGDSKKPRTGTPPIVATGSEPGLQDVMFGAVEKMVGAAMNRQRTRTTVSESDRSREMRLSQGQQAAMLAQMVQKGMRNL